MDYNYDIHHEGPNNIKIFKYMLICTLILLMIGLTTLFLRLIITIIIGSGDPGYLIIAYSSVFIVSLVALLAAIKENFFFLITTATLNIILAGINMFFNSFSWSIILLEIIASLFTFSYTLSMYFKMKLEILQKKRQRRLEEQLHQSNLKRSYDEHIYQIAPKLFDPIQLTNEWIINHRENNNNNVNVNQEKTSNVLIDENINTTTLENRSSIITTPLNTL